MDSYYNNQAAEQDAVLENQSESYQQASTESHPAASAEQADLTPNTPKRPNRLLRVALLNSYLKGQAELMHVENNSLLTGGNAAGKTTLMGAIAPFFGSSLSAVSRKSEAKDSFLDHYLPYENSYIVYEYERDEKMCCAILRRQGETPQFNFFSGGFDSDLFISKGADGGVRFKLYEDVKNSLHEQQRFVSANLKQSEYEAVISNAPINRLKFGSDHQSARTILRLRSDFALATDKKSSFFGFGPIAANVLQDKMSFAEISDFLIEAMKSQDLIRVDNIKLDGSNIDTADWVRKRKAWQEIEGLKPHFEALSAAISTNIMEQHQLADNFNLGNHLLNQLSGDLSAIEADQATKKSDLVSIEREQSAANRAWYETESRIQSDIKIAKNAKEKLEIQKNDFETGSVKLGFDPMVKLKEAVGQISFLQQGIEDNKNKYESLKEQFKKADDKLEFIKAHFKEESQRLAQNKKDEINLIQRSLSENTLEHTQKMRQLDNEYRDAVSALSDAYSSELAQLKDVVADLRVKQGILTAEANGIQYSAQFKDALDLNDKNLNKLRDDYSDANKKVTALRKDLSRTKQDIDELITAKQRNLRTITDEQDAIEQKRAMIQGDTLFSFLLRTESEEGPSEKVNNLRKTIKPSLLSRTDLKPYWDESESFGVFGLNIDASVIANNTGVQTHQQVVEAITLHENNIITLNENNMVIDKDLKKRNAESEKLQKEIQQVEIVVHKAEGDIETAKNDRIVLDAKAKDDKKERTDAIAVKIEAGKVELNAQQEQINRLGRDNEQQLAAIKTSHQELKQQSDNLSKQRVAELNEQLAVVERLYKENLAVAERTRDEAIKNEGYDASVLSDIERDINNLKAKLTYAEKAQRRIEAYDAFMSQEYPEAENLTRKGRELESELAQKTQEHEAASNKTKDVLASLNDEFDANQKLINQLKTDIAHITEHLKRIELTLNKDVIKNHEPAKLEAIENGYLMTESVLNTIRNSLKSARTAIENGIKIVNKIKKPFYENESMFADLLSAHTHRGLTTESNWFLQGDFFELYMQNEHERMKDLIIEKYKVEAMKIEEFKGQLDTVNNSLKKFAKTINKNFSGICEKLNSMAIESLELDLHSKIESNDWYRTLNNFSNAYNSWLGSERLINPLPSDNLLVHLEKVQKDIGQNKLNIKLADQFSIGLVIKQHGQAARKATKDSSMNSLSSNGTIRIAQLIVYLSLVETITKAPCTELKLFVDEIGVIDAKNSTEMLQLLEAQRVTVMCAAPEVVNAEIIPLFSNAIICTQNHKNVYTLSQTTDMESLTKKHAMEQNGAFKTPKTKEKSQ